MIEGWILWLVLASVAIGAVTTWVLMARLHRDEADVDARERAVEAAWIAATIEYHGGIAPVAFVEEVLELHGAYLRAPTREPAPEAPVASLSAAETPLTPPPGPPAQRG